MHSGGGNIRNPHLDRSGAPLLWMSYEAISAGLLMEFHTVELRLEQLGKVHESLKWGWKLFEYFPIRRQSYKGKDDETRL